jgi:hypothetical protein
MTMYHVSRLQPQRFNNNASCMLTSLIIHGKRQRQLSLKVSEPNFTQSASVPWSGPGGGNHPFGEKKRDDQQSTVSHRKTGTRNTIRMNSIYSIDCRLTYRIRLAFVCSNATLC